MAGRAARAQGASEVQLRDSLASGEHADQAPGLSRQIAESGLQGVPPVHELG